MASTSKQSEVTPLEELAALEDAQQKLEEGWALAQTDDLEGAIELLGEALSLRIEHFGELAPECATAYYKYACALFWKAQQDTDVLGGPMTKAKEQATEKAEPSGKGKAPATEEDEEEENGENEEQEEEEESDMELAWKLLETARLIHEKQPGHTVEEADVITTLADISTEREDFETAVKDYGLALHILEELLQDDDRTLAEVCFKTCLAYQLWQQPEPALQFIGRAIATCEKRLERLKGSVQEESTGKGKEKVGESETKEDGEDKKNEAGKAGEAEPLDGEKARKEIADIEALLVDLREKADELREFAKHPSLAALQSDSAPSSSTAPVESSSFDAPQLSASASAPPITNLGVVGRGSVRITPSPAPREATLVVPRKRTMEDMMGGDVSIGFGGPATSASAVLQHKVVSSSATKVVSGSGTTVSVANGHRENGGEKAAVVRSKDDPLDTKAKRAKAEEVSGQAGPQVADKR